MNIWCDILEKNMKILCVLLFLFISVMVFAETKTVFYEDVVYKKTEQIDLMMDIKFVNDGQAKPCILLIHGGGWTGGTKESMENFGLPFFNDVYKQGFVVVSIQYRFLQESPFPACIEDCKTAVQFLRKNAKKYEIDKDNFIACGHSAGGHLVSLLGVYPDSVCKDENLKKYSSKVQGVISFNGPISFDTYNSDAETAYSKNIQGWLGLDTPEKLKLANPIEHIDKDSAKFIVMHSKADGIVYYTPSDGFVKKLKDNNVYCDYFLDETGDHIWDYAQHAEKIMAFLNSFKK